MAEEPSTKSNDVISAPAAPPAVILALTKDEHLALTIAVRLLDESLKPVPKIMRVGKVGEMINVIIPSLFKKLSKTGGLGGDFDKNIDLKGMLEKLK